MRALRSALTGFFRFWSQRLNFGQLRDQTPFGSTICGNKVALNQNLAPSGCRPDAAFTAVPAMMVESLDKKAAGVLALLNFETQVAVTTA